MPKRRIGENASAKLSNGIEDLSGDSSPFGGEMRLVERHRGETRYGDSPAAVSNEVSDCKGTSILRGVVLAT